MVFLQSFLYAMYSGVLAMESLAKGPIGSVIGGGGNSGGKGPGGVKNWATVWMETMAKHGGGGPQYSQSTKDKLAEAPSLNQACCFIGDTKILMKDGSSVIRDIQIGDRLKLGGRVLGVYNFWTQENLYRVGDVTVSGSHLYYGLAEDSLQWIECRACDVPGAVKIKPDKDQPIINYGVYLPRPIRFKSEILSGQILWNGVMSTILVSKNCGK